MCLWCDASCFLFSWERAAMLVTKWHVVHAFRCSMKNCGTTVQNALRAVEGVTFAEVNFENHTATVRGSVNVETLVSLVNLILCVFSQSATFSQTPFQFTYLVLPRWMLLNALGLAPLWLLLAWVTRGRVWWCSLWEGCLGILFLSDLIVSSAHMSLSCSFSHFYFFF